MSSRIISVLGMHRSGTSCLAGSLEAAGVFFGDVQRKNPFNLKGNRENLRIMELHDDLFAAHGGSWDAPPERVEWDDRHRRLRDQIIAGYAGSPLWGFKDPRALFVLEGWLEVLPTMEFVGTVRHPLAVARSLQHRNGFPLERGVEIWIRYNRRLLQYHERIGFPVVSFDLDEEPYRQTLVRVFEGLGLPTPGNATLFFEPELRTRAHTSMELSPEARDLYERLQQIVA